MFEIKGQGVEAFVKKLEKMSEQLAELHHAWPEELEKWQREDMRRKFPNVSTDTIADETSASTEIWPHSRLELQEEQARRQNQRGPKQYRVARAGPTQYRLGRVAPKVHRGPEQPSMRPILRDELKTKLYDRMCALAAEAMKWP